MKGPLPYIVGVFIIVGGLYAYGSRPGRIPTGSQELVVTHKIFACRDDDTLGMIYREMSDKDFDAAERTYARAARTGDCITLLPGDTAFLVSVSGVTERKIRLRGDDTVYFVSSYAFQQ
jgi:hypothetical protein